MNIIVGGVAFAAIMTAEYWDTPETHQARRVRVGEELVVLNPLDTTPNIERYSGYVQDFNTGIMRALQANPDDL